MLREYIIEQITKHNSSTYGLHYTSKTKDWKLFHLIECETVGQAMKIEKHIKKMKSVIYLKNLKSFSAIQIKLLQKYK